MLFKSEQELLTNLLNIPGIRVIGQQRQEDFGIILFVESECKGANCPHCGRGSHKLHQNHYHMIKDLPWNNQDVYLKVNRRQFKCEDCKKPFSEDLEFVAKRRGYTKRYGGSILEQVIESNILSVAQRTNLSEDQIQRIINDAGKELVNQKPEGLKYLGMDEIAMRKGHQSYYGVLVNLETNKPIGLVDGRTQDDLREVFCKWGIEVLEGIEKVTTDLWSPYKNLVEEMMPNAEVIADRFHVMKLINDVLDKERRKEANALKDIEDEEKKKEQKNIFRKGKYPLLKNKDNLNESDKEKLEKVKSISPKLATMYDLKEEFRAIFEDSKNWAIGTLNLLDWIVKASDYYFESCQTIVRWFGEVTAYFEHQLSNGLVEGINNKLKLIKRSGFGFRNFQNFNLRALLSW